jgi:signal transduction histidine kinase/ligand-binding sensor domain-containing protein
MIAALMLTSSAMALDPARALTQYNHRIWQMQQGLPQASIYASLQSRDGFIWLGTLTGLVRFDGVRFTPLNNAGDVSLEKIWVRCLAEDRDQSLWVGTDGQGLYRISPSAPAHFDSTNGLPSNVIHALVTNPDGTVWIATAGGLVKYSQGGFKVLGSSQGISCDDIRCVAAALNGKLWVAGPDPSQIYVGDGNSFTHVEIKSIPPFNTITSMAITAGGQIWIGTSSGILRLDHDEQRWFTSRDGLANDCVYCLNNGSDGALWAGTKDGFSRLRSEGIESFRANDGLSQSSVFTVMEDHEGSLWVGTKHGLNQFSDRRAIPFTISEGLSSNKTGAIMQDSEGNILVGTKDAGLSRFDGRRFVPAGQIGAAAISMAPDSTDGFWVGTDHGLKRMQHGQLAENLTTADGLPADEITCLQNESDGTLWVGTPSGVATLRNRKIVALRGIDTVSHTQILTIGHYHGSILLATTGGLLQYSKSKLAVFSGGQNASTAWLRDIDCLCEDHAGMLWIGTHGDGLRLIDGNRQFAFSIRQGLFDDDIFGITIDDFDRVWMACSKGVFWVQRDDLLRLAAGQTTTIRSFPFSPTDNLRTVECQSGVQPVVIKAADGKIWFSTIRGVIVFDPAHLLRTAAVPPPTVEEVIVNGQSQEPGSIHELSPWQRNLEFRYAGLSFASPNAMRFRYQLEGFDKDWIDAGTRREAFYTNLSPGKYRFKVMASYPETAFSGAPAILQFILLPRFYQRVWFLPMVALVMVALGISLYRGRMQRIRQRIAAIVAERSRIARELHDTLLQGFSGVTMEMQALSMRLSNAQERGVLQGIIQDAAACMREARRSVAGLRNPRGEQGLAAAIEQSATQVTETQNVRLRLKLSQNLPVISPETEYNLLRITQEAVTNAVKHASASMIEVTLVAKSGELRITVKDDGRGFDPQAQVQGQHFGLVGIKERASTINAAIRIDSRPGRGTTVTTTLPIKPRPSSGVAALTAVQETLP